RGENRITDAAFTHLRVLTLLDISGADERVQITQAAFLHLSNLRVLTAFDCSSANCSFNNWSGNQMLMTFTVIQRTAMMTLAGVGTVTCKEERKELTLCGRSAFFLVANLPAVFRRCVS